MCYVKFASPVFIRPAVAVFLSTCLFFSTLPSSQNQSARHLAGLWHHRVCRPPRVARPSKPTARALTSCRHVHVRRTPSPTSQCTTPPPKQRALPGPHRRLWLPAGGKARQHTQRHVRCRHRRRCSVRVRVRCRVRVALGVGAADRESRPGAARRRAGARAAGRRQVRRHRYEGDTGVRRTQV